MAEGKINSDDSIQKWKNFVDDWRQDIDDNATINAHHVLSRTNVNGHH